MAFPIENFLTPNLTNMLVTLVIPFLIIFAVLLFALRKTGVLGSNNAIYVVISLGITFMIYVLNPGNVFQFLVSYLFQIGVAGAIIALMGVVIFIFFGMIRWGSSAGEKLKSDEQKFKNLEKEEEKLMKKFHKEGVLGVGGTSLQERRVVLERLKDLQEKKKYLALKMRRLA